MFLDTITRRNPALIDAAISLHQSGELPANTYAFDLEAVQANARTIAAEAGRLGITPYAMLKQVGRNPDFTRAVMAGGIEASVAVDMQDARATHRAGMRLGHVGHLVQVPRAEAAAAASMAPEHWTVFGQHKAHEAASAAAGVGREQRLLARVFAERDQFYSGHEGGFPAEDILTIADRLNALASASFAGITTFPAMLFDKDQLTVRPTRNLQTLQEAAGRLRSAGWTDLQVNAPGTTSTRTLAALAEAGATQVEPGHALTGTTPWHAVEDLPEIPAAVYVTEVSHQYGGRAYCFGGGLYVDPVFPPYQIRGLVGRSADQTEHLDATFPPREAIDYYAQLDLGTGRAEPGDTVVFGFRIQAFVTRAYTAGITGITSGNPQVAGVYTTDGSPAAWPS
jgi:predicted amino acid racemase